jgi:ferrous iron transport protein B
MGNPNVGKSVVFNRLTGVDVMVSNYPGTTVEVSRGRLRVGGEKAELVDVPGTYTLEPTTRAEEVAVRMLGEADLVIDVIDATNLERSLNLTLQLLGRGVPTLVALNLWDEAGHLGVDIDVDKLEKLLGVPCVPTVATTGQGIKTLVERITEVSAPKYDYLEDQRWQQIGRILKEVQRLSHRHHTWLERLGDASVTPVTGIPIALVVLFVTFETVRLIGESLIGYLCEPVFERLWAPLMLKLSSVLSGGGFLHGILIGALTEDGQIDFVQSLGLLTTGLFVPFAMVLPYVFAFYLVLSFLEDSGYLPRFLMHRVGLHGLSIIPMILGLGCNVPAALSTRIMETKRERFIAATLVAITVPCMAQISMIVGLVGRYGASGFVPIFGTLFIVWLVLGRLLNRFMKGESPEILVDIPPYRIPYFRGLLKKVWIRLKWFVREAVPWVLAGVLVVNIFYELKVMAMIEKLASPMVVGVLGLRPQAVAALVVGFLRKDVAVGMLAPLGLDLKQLIVACVVLAMYFPCVATFAALVRELGIRDMLKAAVLMLVSALIVGGLLNLMLSGLEALLPD